MSWIGLVSVVLSLVGFAHAQSSESDVQVVSIDYDLGNNVVAPDTLTLSMTNVSPETVETASVPLEYTLATATATVYADITSVDGASTETNSPADVGLADPALSGTQLRDSRLELIVGQPGGRDIRLNDEDTWYPVAIDDDGVSILSNYGQASTHQEDIFFALRRPDFGPGENLETTIVVTFTVQEGN
ncbi:MAG: hypothetical protein RI554_10810 [Trueperaceae bacterium]|nr:hypothetical protein [Trueperaceae bacterium]